MACEEGTFREPGMKKVTIEYDPQFCPVRDVMAQISDKWSILVLTGLRQGEKRFSELKRGIPDISQRMLTQTLRNLEREGLVSRKVTPTVPPRVDYSLTKLGLSLVGVLLPVATWAIKQRYVIEAARTRFDTANSP
jgi:DNA-binding HxlR family transcriptional regulator